MRPIHVMFALLGTLIVTSAALDFRWIIDGQHWMRSVISNEAGRFKAVEVEGRVAAQLNSARSGAHQGTLESDEDLRVWLAGRVENGAINDLDALAASVQSQFPRYVRLAACTLQGVSVADLLKKASDWSDQTGRTFTHQAIIAWTKPVRLGFECVIVTGRRLEDFEPAALTRGHNEFYIMCSNCRRGQACEIPPLMRSVTIECPNCHHPYTMLAVDTAGRYHHVNEYLTGYAPPARFPSGITRLNEMLLIWNSVVRGIRYLPDTADGDEANDAWQTAPETQQLGTGDCEDSSIYLADWLIARGFEARVAVGHYAERGGHAWVIVRLEGATYLLESTNPDVNTSRPPTLDEVGSRYVPDATIDRGGFYTRRTPSAPWDGDYWTEGKWWRVIPHAKKMVASAKADAEP